ncbi:MAG TPA: glycosyltransferase family 2 protein [Candidatus Lustribacter sp.]|nr:glycosyltransferase family 2 protein [Candidatus Lustribacter sp.]
MTSTPNDTVWVVLAVFNEASVVGDVVRGLRVAFPHVVCVDDGSADDSAGHASRAGAVVVRHPVNLGQGAALQTGFEYALRDPGMRYVVTYDADGQHQVDDVRLMLDRIRAGDVDVVFGSRFLDERTSPSLVRALVLRAAVAYTNLTTHTKLSDAHNGLRVLSRDVVARLQITQNRMAHATELVGQVGAMTLAGRPVRYAEAPVHILYTEYSSEKGQSLWNAINILVDLILH